MMPLAVESKMDFDYSVGTEDRFALRNWFEGFIRDQNEANVAGILKHLDDDFIIEGWGGAPITYKEATELIEKAGSVARVIFRYPEVRVKFRHVLFSLQGSFEGYCDDILSYDGTFEGKIRKQDESFKLAYVKVYPRFMLSSLEK